MNKLESGRSMVEMLGVLAIIGVLSIGGIAGYTTAMNRFRANEIIDIASKISVMGMTKTGTNPATTDDLDYDMPSEGLHGVSTIEANKDGVVKLTLTAAGLSAGVSKALKSIAADNFSSTLNSSGTTGTIYFNPTRTSSRPTANLYTGTAG